MPSLLWSPKFLLPRVYIYWKNIAIRIALSPRDTRYRHSRYVNVYVKNVGWRGEGGARRAFSRSSTAKFPLPRRRSSISHTSCTTPPLLLAPPRPGHDHIPRTLGLCTFVHPECLMREARPGGIVDIWPGSSRDNFWIYRIHINNCW